MFGSHLSIAGGLHNALLEAKKLGMDCVQVFTANQRQWTPKQPDEEAVRAWHEHRESTGIGTAVSHDSYLINLASPKDDLRTKSIDLFRSEMLRCEALEIPYLVTHPGAHVGEGEEAGLARVAAALSDLHREQPGLRLITCLEVTAGQGTSLGSSFEHLATIIDQTAQPERLGVCLDTAHMLAAGYDLTSAAGAKAVLDELDATLGLERVKVIHVNDSKTPRGSRVDRHAHIGEGHLSLDALGVLLRKKAFAKTPKILETPKEDHDSGEPWDAVNLRTLRGLVRGKR